MVMYFIAIVAALYDDTSVRINTLPVPSSQCQTKIAMQNTKQNLYIVVFH